ncbi:DUF5134 domain-containing protein [Streptomyces pactum]|uniref:DUF5134 domain-containing protein n=1 Tax=Streptomyces pactum TaxID=68249 RepID=A0ABS0NUC6_9ACTN|nr:DUF5134 domain-containing protein [Streptomyces pactum]MBH5338818.1 DUF5134 domain-containing protein [Streptomyces pactum]
MHGPPLVGWLLLVLGAAGGAYCTARARAAPPGPRRAFRAEAALGWGMAVMAVPAVTAPDSALWARLTAVAAGAAALPALSVRRRAGTGGWGGHHTVEAVAMIYMSVAAVLPAPGDGAGHTGHGTGPTGPSLVLTAVLLGYFAGYAVRAGLRLVPVAAAGPAPGAVALTERPELAAACRLAMSVAMCGMLLTM